MMRGEKHMSGGDMVAEHIEDVPSPFNAMLFMLCGFCVGPM